MEGKMVGKEEFVLFVNQENRWERKRKGPPFGLFTLEISLLLFSDHHCGQDTMKNNFPSSYLFATFFF